MNSGLNIRCLALKEVVERGTRAVTKIITIIIKYLLCLRTLSLALLSFSNCFGGALTFLVEIGLLPPGLRDSNK